MSCIAPPFLYSPGFVPGFPGTAFLSGLETPMLISRKVSPLRSRSSSFIAGSPSLHTGHFLAAGSASTGAAGDVSPFKIATAAWGRGLSAFANSTLTCHISVSERISL